MIISYDVSIEVSMSFLYQTLSEKDRRLYAAIEAFKLGYGGISYISRILKCDRNTIYRGIWEMNNPEETQKNKERANGAGRKKSIDNIPELDKKFLDVLRNYTAGDPMDEKIRWTNLGALPLIL